MNIGPTVINTLTNEGTGRMNTISFINTLTPGNNRRNTKRNNMDHLKVY